jgi:hypothetical protein
MSNQNDERVRMREGKQRLRKLLPIAKQRLEDERIGVQTVSALAKAQAAHLREDNLEALTVYPAPLGGWHADVILRHTPPGVPNAFGSPVGNPYQTREQAERAALDLLTFTLMIASQEAAPTTPVFLLYGGEFALAPEILWHPLAHGFGSKEAAVAKLDDVMQGLFGDAREPTTEAFKELSREQMLAMSYTIHRAALDGVFAYPIRRDKSPSGHDEDATRMKQ